MEDLEEAVDYLNRVAAITRADFHQLPEIRCLLYIKKNLPAKLSELGMMTNIDQLLKDIAIPADGLRDVDELDKEQFEELMEAFVNALANTIHLYSSADLPINWDQLFTLDK